jgi:hypothetical protein
MSVTLNGTSGLVFSDGTTQGTAGYTSLRNKLINGDFRWWVRATTGGTGVNDAFGAADRWRQARVTFTRQTHPTGTAFTSSKYYANVSYTSAASSYILQAIENVFPLAGKYMTVSYWAKSSTSSPIYYLITQRYGTGGTGGDTIANYVPQALTTTWTKYSYTFQTPSLTGKTIGPHETTSLDVGFYGSNATASTGNFDISDIQVEEGQYATAFENRPAGLELSLCQRYYENGETFVRRQNIDTAPRNWQEAFNFNTRKRIQPVMAHTLTNTSSFGSASIGANALGNGYGYTCAGNGSSIDFQFISTWSADAEIY